MAVKIWDQQETSSFKAMASWRPGNTTTLEEMEREIATLTRLRHPNILNVYGLAHNIPGSPSPFGGRSTGDANMLDFSSSGVLSDGGASKPGSSNGLEEGTVMMVMQYAENGSLKTVLQNAAQSKQPMAVLPWAKRVRIAAEIAAGVDFLHSQTPPIVHCDLKCDNVVMTEARPFPSECPLLSFAFCAGTGLYFPK